MRGGGSIAMKHLLKLIDHSREQIDHWLTCAATLKAERKRGVLSTALAGKVVGLVFEKPSLRTRVSFEAAVAQLGGTSLFLPGNEVGLGWRETLADFSRTISGYLDALVLRVFRQETIDGLAQHGKLPIINGLSDAEHPCQALADLLTIHECLGTVAGKKVVFVGDGNNVAKSLAIGVVRMGGSFVLACPKGYEFDEEFVQEFTSQVGPLPAVVSQPREAVTQADIIYTDVWTSMGQEAEREERLRHFAEFQVNRKLLECAPKHCKILHCLPAHRGEEITDEAMEGPQSVVFQQAENRLHAQKAVLSWLFK
jgi:ornithine carbamoyltransferase